MFGVHIACQRGLCGKFETIGSSSEGIRRNEDDECADRHAALELGGRIGKEAHFHHSELLLCSRRTSPRTLEPATGETSKAITEKPPQTKEQPMTANMEVPQTTNVNVILDKEDRQPAANDLAELLAIHHQFGHILMRKLQEMAKQGILPR